MEFINDLLLINSTFDVVVHIGVAAVMVTGSLCTFIHVTR